MAFEVQCDCIRVEPVTDTNLDQTVILRTSSQLTVNFSCTLIR